MPFVVKSLNGSDTDVGLCFMAQMGVYVCFCVYAGVVADRLRPRKVLIISSIGQVLVTIGIFAAIWFRTKLVVSPIYQLVFLMSLIGIITAFYWPVMMGWLSRGHEGAELTRRFGFYNVSWGSANMLLPIAGGYLMEINYLVPIASAAMFMVFGLIAVYDMPSPVRQPKADINQTSENLIEQLNPLNRQFVWISRVALLCVYICVGMFRSQLGILYKYELGFGESIFGWSVAVMCLLNVTIFFIMGKSHFWHYKKGWYISSQFLMVVSMAIVIFSRNLFIQLFAVAIAGYAYAVVYSSHQYYCIAGGRRRAGRMAIHETIIGAGYATGSIVGGLISDHFGRFWPYIFGSALILAGGVIQYIVWFALDKKGQGSSKAKTSFLTSPT